GTPPNLVYLGATNYFGSDSFRFKVNDRHADSASATVSITITPVNDPPVAQSMDITVNENAPQPIILQATDAENDPLTFTVLSLPAHGTLGGTPPQLIYNPETNYFGSDSFQF